MKLLKIACAWLAVFYVGSRDCLGQTLWTAGTDDWSTTTNWSAGSPSLTTDAQINNGGTATLSGAAAQAKLVNLGLSAGNSGTLNVQGGQAVFSSELNVGNAGAGTLSISGGGKVTNTAGIIGRAIGGAGAATVDGAGSAWTNTADLSVGNFGEASLRIAGGAVVSNVNGSVGTSRVGADSGNGTVEVEGPGSMWTNSGALRVGWFGEGALSVLGGGKVVNAAANIGDSLGSVGAATVDGAGSEWTSNGILAVGLSGTGALTIKDGGKVSNTNGRIGREVGSTGTVTVSGPNTSWHNNGDLWVGLGGGTGTLNIEDQALVHVDDTLAIASTLGVVNLRGGTLRFNTASGLNRLNYTSGTIQLAGSRALGTDGDATIPALFGAFPTTISGGKGLVVEGSLNVGVQSQGGYELHITNGGTLHSDTGIIGGGEFAPLEPIGAGEVVVRGAGSAWTAGYIEVGSFIPNGEPGYTILSSLAIEDEGVVDAELLWVRSQGIVNLKGGTLRVGNFFSSLPVGYPGEYEGYSPGQFNFYAGTIQVTGNRVVGHDKSISDLVGAAPKLTSEKALTIEGAATLATTVTIDGGTFSVGALVNGHHLAFQRGTLNITNHAVTISPGGPLGGALDVDDDMTVNVTLGLTNRGLVTGDGQIGGTFTNAAGGELRADPGKSLTLIGADNTNAGQIKLLGGSLDFHNDLTNDAGGFISGNGSLLTGGLTNRGTMNFAGTANIVGDVANAADGKIISGGGGATIFFDDVANDGEIRTSTNGFTVFFGNVAGGGAFTGTGTVNFEGDLAPGKARASLSSPGT